MLRRNMRPLTPRTDTLFRGIRHRRVSHLNATPNKELNYSSTILEESITELNEMVERIGNIKLDKSPEPGEASTSTSQASGSNESTKSTCDASSSTMDLTEEPAKEEKTETAEKPEVQNTEINLVWTMALMVNDGILFKSIRGALDSESKYHIITDKCRRKLKLPLFKMNSPPPAPADATRKILGKTVVTISSYFNRKRVFTLEAIVVDKICTRTPSMIVHPAIKHQLDFFKLADPNFDVPGAVDMVVGSGLYTTLVKGRPCFVLGKSCCVLQSLLGWVVGGKAPIDPFQLNKTTEDTSEKLSLTVKEVEQYFGNLAPAEKKESE